jgi:uncharacterized protein YdiU (UPF0061 family)
VEALFPLFDPVEEKGVERAQELVDGFPATFTEAWHAGMRKKLGLCGVEEGDTELIKRLLEEMLAAQADYTNTFRALSGDESVTLPASLTDWVASWEARIAPDRNGRSREDTHQEMLRTNPAVIARNHLVEAALRDAVDNQNYSTMSRLVEALRSPFVSCREYMVPPPEGEDQLYRTFCGT